ncbi:MAG: PaaI family thioesterase [Betaproteobacteria bacterium]|nr:PaaI family thioesterase [Betaproteobacteria bacterium]
MNDNDPFSPFECPGVKAPLNDDWTARREAAEAVRQLISNLVTTNCNAAALRAVAETIRQQTARLTKEQVLYGRRAFEDHAGGGHGSLHRIAYELNPLDGKSNPISPPFITWIEGDVAHGRATLGWQYEGPPNTVHGGFVCALFDQFLGIAQSMTGQPGVTGTLTARLNRPTPLCTELQLIARVKQVVGRKNTLTGEIWANGVMTASCECVFIHVSGERFRQLQQND